MFWYESLVRQGKEAKILSLELAYSVDYNVKADRLIGSEVTTFKKVNVNLN